MNIFRLNKIKIRILYWVSVILLMAFIVCPIFFFFYLFDEDQVKQMLYTKFDNNLYHLEVNGTITPRFWHGLSLEINNLVVATNNKNQLLHIKSAYCQLSWFDLVFAHHKIKRLALDNVDINEKNINRYDLNNLLTFTKSGKSIFSSLDNISIFGINSSDINASYPIKDGLLTVTKTPDGGIYKLGFQMGESGVYFASNGVMSSISRNLIKLRDFSVNIYDDDMRIKFGADTSYHILEKQLTLDNLSGTVFFTNYKSDFSVAKSIFSLDNASFNNLNFKLNFKNKFASQSIKLNLTDLNMPNYKNYILGTSQINYQIAIESSTIELHSTLNQLQLNDKILTSKDCRNQLNYISPIIPNNKFSGVESGLCTYDFKNYIFNLSTSGDLNGAPLKLNLSVNNEKDKPKIQVNGLIDDLDLSLFSAISTKLMPFYYNNQSLPFSWFSLFNIEGSLDVKHFSFGRLHLNDVSTEFKLDDAVLNISKLRANIYQGILYGSAKISKEDKGYNISTKQIINNLDLKEMFQDLFDVEAITGKANLKIDAITSNANTYVDLHKYLNGKIIVDAKNGAFQGVDFNLFSASSALNINKSTIFQKLNAELNFVNGISKLGNIVFYSPYLIAKGSGMVDFVNTKIDYIFTIKSALPPNKQEISSVVIPVSTKGYLFDPQISIQNIHFDGNNILRKQVRSKRRGRTN